MKKKTIMRNSFLVFADAVLCPMYNCKAACTVYPGKAYVTVR